ncbi:MAG TPA: glutathione peroxidase [Flavobacteriales bacterium]|nr:glutathione peroxidase [Flavobacteriales bacterium]HNU55623.1 glutathione peroxidase [Flavobacteriales bacterium]
MRSLLPIISVVLLATACFNRVQVGPVSIPVNGQSTRPIPPMSFFDLSATDINGQLVKLDQFRGKHIMVVNTASECGYTPQYAQLQELYGTYRDKGLVILGFPSNDFGGQEPGTEAQIASFCQKNYGVTFPMMAKVSTKGDDQHPVYHWLANKSQNGVMDTEVKWNFHKYLIDPDGLLRMSLESGIEPSDERVIAWIEGR